MGTPRTIEYLGGTSNTIKDTVKKRQKNGIVATIVTLFIETVARPVEIVFMSVSVFL